ESHEFREPRRARLRPGDIRGRLARARCHHGQVSARRARPHRSTARAAELAGAFAPGEGTGGLPRMRWRWNTARFARRPRFRAMQQLPRAKEDAAKQSDGFGDAAGGWGDGCVLKVITAV